MKKSVVIAKKLNQIAKSSKKSSKKLATVHLTRSVNGTVRICLKKSKKQKKTPKPLTVRKPIGGEKNGEFRNVLIKKHPNYYPAVHKSHRRRIYRDRPHWNRKLPTVRKSLTPGRVLILLAGKHRGKRTVLLKVLKSGLLVITGPFRVNGCPIRRMHPQYVIATKTEIDMSDVKVPSRINNAYFKKDKKAILKLKKAQKEKSKDIFKETTPIKKKLKKTVRQKKDQAFVDRMLLGAIKKRPDWRVLIRYLKSRFGLKGTQYPHRLKF